MSALTLAQAAAGGGLNLDTGTVVAVVGTVLAALGTVLAALVSVFGLRLGARLAAIEKGQEGLASALERLERRLEDGLARLTDRIDRLYGTSPGPPPVPLIDTPTIPTSEDLMERLAESIRRASAAREDEPDRPPGEAS